MKVHAICTSFVRLLQRTTRQQCLHVYQQDICESHDALALPHASDCGIARECMHASIHVSKFQKLMGEHLMRAAQQIVQWHTQCRVGVSACSIGLLGPCYHRRLHTCMPQLQATAGLQYLLQQAAADPAAQVAIRIGGFEY